MMLLMMKPETTPFYRPKRINKSLDTKLLTTHEERRMDEGLSNENKTSL